MEAFLTSNEWPWRLEKTIVQGVESLATLQECTMEIATDSGALYLIADAG